MENKKLSCGVLVVDKERNILMFNDSHANFWDIPKGGQEPGEKPVETAVRELEEETSLVAKKEDLIDIGVFQYNYYKDLYLFVWVMDEIREDKLKADKAILKRPGDIDKYDIVFNKFRIDNVKNKMCKSMRFLFESKLIKEIEIELRKKLSTTQ